MSDTLAITLFVLLAVMFSLVAARSIWYNMERARLFMEAKWKYDEAYMAYGEAQTYYLIGSVAFGEAAHERGSVLQAEADALSAQANEVKFNPFRKKD